jgi:Flp pilus assembly protein TadG
MIRSVQARLRNFRRDRRGVSAVEFALLSPLMIALYLGGVEISDGIGIDRKVTLTTGAIANLAAQVSSITSADMTDMLKAGTSVMAPYSTAPLAITVSCLKIDSNKVAKVKWSETKGGTKRGTNTTVTIPSALAVANTQLLFSEVSYTYTPIFAHIITGTLTLSDKMYMSPRISAPTYGTTACT